LYCNQKKAADLRSNVEKIDEATSKPLFPITDLIGTSTQPSIDPIPVPDLKVPLPNTGTQPTQNRQPLPPPAPIQAKNQTEEKKKNLADADRNGIPRDQLGPSGLPKVNVVKHPSEKRARDAARSAGQRSPAKDASTTKGGPHYHPTNRDGSRKKGKQNVHHEYPN
jgi:hypothetical protein